MLIQKKRLKDYGTSLKVDVIEQHIFDPHNLSQYTYLFKHLKDQGTIQADSFHDNVWLYKRKSDGGTHTLKFDLEAFPLLVSALKCYVLLKISSGSKSVYGGLRYLKEICKTSFGFDIAHLSNTEEILIRAKQPKRNQIATYVSEFLSFIAHRNKTSFLRLTDSYRKHYSSIRDLPKYTDILVFDYIVQNFFQNCSNDELLVFYPIQLWWRITTIVPLRISEFLQLRKDCAVMKEDSTYWITVPRLKKRTPGGDPRTFDVVDTVQINNEVFQLIQTYLDYTDPENNSNYLITFRTYPGNQYRRLESQPMQASDLLVTNKTRFNSLLHSFYKKIVGDRYGYHDIEYVSCGDTRHFAFCNMMLQGWNMLSIARMGGHTQLRTQLHYHAHVDYFVQSWVFNLAQRNKMEHLNKKVPESSIAMQQTIAKSKIFQAEDYEQKYEVDHGYCTYSPEKCEVGDCRYCPHFLFVPKQEQEGMNWLMNCSHSLEQRIEEQLALLKQISLDIQYDLKLLKYQHTGQERLFSVANELNRFMQQKARVDAYLEEI